MSHVVVSVRMPHAGVHAGAPSYLDRARALMSRAEAFGATLVAWGGQSIAFAWDADGIEEAIAFVESLGDDTKDAALAWSCGIAEGEMNEVSAGRGTLAWGEPLVTAESLARIAEPGEALADERVHAVRRGELATMGVKPSTDSGKRVTGLRVNLSRPWKKPSSAKLSAVQIPPPPASIRTGREEPEETIEPDQTGEVPVPSFVRRHDGLEPGALELADATLLQSLPPMRKDTATAPPLDVRAALAERVEELAGSPKGAPMKTIIALMKARARAEGPVARCQASLALSVGLAMAGRPQEALLEAIDALGRARESGDAKAAQACLAMIGKLYVAQGRTEDATLLRVITE